MSSIYDWSLTASDNDDADSIINWLENQLPNTVNNSARAMMQRMAELLKDMGGAITATGTANAIVLTAASPFTILTDGLLVSFKAALSNTSATTTIAVNGLASKPIRKQGLGGDIAISPNDIRQNGIYRLVYSTAANSGTGAWMLQGSAGSFETGTKLLFQQTTAPTGWTKDTSNNDKALRVVSGSVGTGGSLAFTTVFTSQNVGATALLSTQIPPHAHNFSGTTGTESVAHTHTVSVTGVTSTDGDHTHVVGANYIGSGTSSNAGYITPSGLGATTSSNGAHSHTVSASGTSAVQSANHTHSITGTTDFTGGGGTHTHTLNLAVQYVDVIVATKD
ncbi:hypothetical protein [Mesorhizobium sp. Pch-S]|uniref:hypothetical protein n=1 Tax=Mesorhizobium sp. Pch-S TaxID=2082387 RepID=UPI001010260B|nr:hypothetical protein [Mesorhizobium sp. Pch-S]QAZ46756.1 hypothetical protein C1M53_31375 [Mesorhizobium sp. Pch-S]